VKLLAARIYKEPKPTQQTTITLNKAILGKQYKKDTQLLEAYVDKLTEAEKVKLKTTFDAEGKLDLKVGAITFALSKDNMSIEQKIVNLMEEKYIPHVIEPSFGLGRILYCVLEHCFRVRDEKRTYFGLKPRIAPVKVSLLPLQSDSKFDEPIHKLRKI
jgi:glycyl-tRNA synthetase